MDERNLEHELTIANIELGWARALQAQAGTLEDYRQTTQTLRNELAKAQAEVKKANESKDYWFNKWQETQEESGVDGE